jgi:hypothetical protein
MEQHQQSYERTVLSKVIVEPLADAGIEMNSKAQDTDALRRR